MSDCDENDVVSYGTPLAKDDEEDEALRKRPVSIEEQEVRDERGLRRFHGAFTGGFSAGYFNTVGTKEGWTPSTFLSSRAERAGRQNQRPEDYMDTEDLGEFGIAPRAIKVNKDFAEEPKANKSARKRQLLFNEGPIPGLPPLKDLIVPSSESAGVKLLRKMGWKPGQGIGPRVKKSKKRKPKNVAVVKEIQERGVKIYGCHLPEDISLEEDSEDEALLQGITFAPDDVEVLAYAAKDDFHGIGYKGLHRDPVLATFRSGKLAIEPAMIRDKKTKLAITGEAFGVGVYEEDDENIYCLDDMSQYDFELEGSISTSDNDANSRGRNKGHHGRNVKRVNPILEGFHLTSKFSLPRKCYSPPDLPKNFQPIHGHITRQHVMTVLDRHQMTATERAEIINTEKPKGSVFDLLRPEDRQRLMALSNKKPLEKPPASPLVTTPTLPSNTPMEIAISSVLSAARSKSSGTSGFRPFISDPDKQKRYELYLKFKDDQKQDEVVFQRFQPHNMTEWEKQREMEEFRQAAVIYRPLSRTMSSRFVSAKQADVDDETKKSVTTTIQMTATLDVSEKKVVEELQYGEATRSRIEWHPDPLLCRRFNVADPYPESSMVGVPKKKRPRFSLANLFEVADENNTKENDQYQNILEAKSQDEPSTSDKATTHDSAKKPVAVRPSIFANLDDIETKPKGVTQTTTTTSTSSSSLDQTAGQTESTAEKEDAPTRPPLDLFRAIFQNTDSEISSSDSDSDDDDDENNVIKVEAKKDGGTPMEATTAVGTNKAVPVTSRHTAAPNRAPTIGLFRNLDWDNLDKASEAAPVETKSGGQKRISSVAIKAPEPSYGPVLPPPQAIVQVLEMKSKPKHKHKHKKKSKHKKHRRRKDQSSSESSESESEMAIPDLNKVIKSKLKKMAK